MTLALPCDPNSANRSGESNNSANTSHSASASSGGTNSPPPTSPWLCSRSSCSPFVQIVADAMHGGIGRQGACAWTGCDCKDQLQHQTYGESEQAPRLFGFIASGASIGAIIGPSIPILFVNNLGVMNLLLISAVILLIPVPIINKLENLKNQGLSQQDYSNQVTNRELEQDFLSGFKVFLKNPYLILIAIFILLYVVMSTFIYFELRKFLIDFDRETRTQIWASIDLIVNIVAIITAVFATSRLVSRFGMSFLLALIPLIMIGGWIIVALSPFLIVLIGLQIVRRAGNYAVTKPGREMLFTMFDNETRYKAKPFIDIVIYRGGDMVTAWFYTLLTATYGFSLSLIAIIASFLAAIWAYIGFHLGRKYNDQDDIIK